MRNERGVILILVVWALTALMVLAAEVARTMRIEGLTADTYHQEAVTYYLALAGFHDALYEFLRAPQKGQTLLTQPGAVEAPPQGEKEQKDIWARGDGRWYGKQFGGGGYRARVNDEGGKINLNQADESLLRQVFTNLNFDAKFGDALTDAILDWRDSDSLVRLHGAETDDYLARPTPYPAKDGLFDTLDELLLVRGVSPALFYGREGPALRDLFTVYSAPGGGRGSINLLTAGPLALQAAMGIDAEAAQELVQRRTEVGAAELAGLLPAGAGRVIHSLPSVVTIESIGYVNGNEVTRRLSAVVQRQGVNRFRFLRWQDQQESEPSPPPLQAEE